MNRRDRRRQAVKKAKKQKKKKPVAAPDDADALNQKGVLLAESGRADEGEGFIRRALAVRPGEAGTWNNLGTVLSRLGRAGEAWEAYREALRLEPENPRTLSNAGGALKALGRLDQAVAYYERALEMEPDSAEILSNYGNVLLDLGRPIEAISAQQKALELDPDYPPALNNLGVALKRRGRYGDAMRALARAVELSPAYGDALNNLGEVMKESGQAAEALVFYRRAMEVAPNQPTFAGNFLFTLNAVDDVEAKLVAREHRNWGERFADHMAPAGRPDDADFEPDRVLRVGYVSADFRRHSVACFAEPLLRHHHRNMVHVTCYFSGNRPDAVTERLKGMADAWRDIGGMADEAAAAMIGEDKIDILVDLAGHTDGNRLLLFALKPAPVLATWLGYPNTTGLRAMDYRITDGWADPPGKGDDLYSEKLVRLEGGFLCYAPPGDAPDPAWTPPVEAGKNGRPFTFGSCNNLAKVTPRVIETWAEILRARPDARFLLKAKALGDEGTAKRIAGMFERHGIDGRRIGTRGWITDESHLAVYDLIDVALDTFPYNGATTTCEALWMGAPVITLAGDRHAGRVGVSIINQAGLCGPAAGLIAESRPGYVARALALAGDPERLAAMRREIRAKMAASLLMDGPAFSRRLEAAYRRMDAARRGAST